MKQKWTAVIGTATFITAFGFLVIFSCPVRADSGAIQLQRIPNLLLETEGPDATPPGVDSNLVVSSGVNTNGFGRVVLTKRNGKQDFLVETRNLPPGPTAFNFAYGVFIADAPGSTNFNKVGVMNLLSTNQKRTKGHWILHYTQTNGIAPPQLGVADLSDLAGLELRIVTSPLSLSPTQVVLHAVLPPVLANPAVLSARTNMVMSLPPSGPGSPPSPQAVGTLTIRFDGRNGRSYIAIRASKLSAGTGYIVFLEDAPGSGTYTELDELNEPRNFPNRLAGGSFVLDTQRGDPVTFFAETPADLAGRTILVVDAFFDAFNPSLSSVHLMATIPSFP